MALVLSQPSPSIASSPSAPVADPRPRPLHQCAPFPPLPFILSQVSQPPTSPPRAHMAAPPQVFYGLVSSFVAFFALFALVIYPNAAALHPTVFVDSLAAVLPSGFTAPLAIIRNWTCASHHPWQ